MAPLTKMFLQVLVVSIAGGLGGYFLAVDLPVQTVAEIARTVGNLSLIAGGLIGVSVGWISQSRGIVRDIDYNNVAIEIFQELGKLQIEIIRRWEVVFVSSLLSVACAILMEMRDLNCVWYILLLVLSLALATVGVVFILYLFQRMLALSHLKSELEEYEHGELRRKRMIPEERRTKLRPQQDPPTSETSSVVLP